MEVIETDSRYHNFRVYWGMYLNMPSMTVDELKLLIGEYWSDFYDEIDWEEVKKRLNGDQSQIPQ